MALRHLLGMREFRTGRIAAMQPKKWSMTVHISAWEDTPIHKSLDNFENKVKHEMTYKLRPRRFSWWQYAC